MVDEYGNETGQPDPLEELRKRAEQSGQGYNETGTTTTAPPPVNSTSTPPAGYQPPANPTQSWNTYDYEKTRKGWAYGGNGFASQVSEADLDKFLADNASGFTAGVTRRGDTLYDPTGRRMFDAIGNLKSGDPTKYSRIALEGNSGPKPKGGINSGQSIIGGGNAGNPKVAGPGGSAPPAAPRPPAVDPRINELYEMLKARATQGLSIDPKTNPVIRGEADAYAASEERARRNYLADMAESAGPNANLRGEERMAAEHAGQRSAANEAALVGRELTAKRDEIAMALQQMQGMLTEQQRNALQKELALMDDAIKRAQLKQQQSQFAADLAYRNRALAEQGRQYDGRLGYDYDRFDWDRSPLNSQNFPRT